MILAALLLLASASEDHPRPTVRDFCMKDDEVAYADTKGTFEMQARLTITGSHYVLRAWNVMPDISQILSFEADGTYRAKGATRIRFIDNWDNRGQGSFQVKGSTLVLDIEPPSIDDDRGYRNIRRNYGNYVLVAGRGCRWGQQP